MQIKIAVSADKPGHGSLDVLRASRSCRREPLIVTLLTTILFGSLALLRCIRNHCIVFIYATRIFTKCRTTFLNDKADSARQQSCIICIFRGLYRTLTVLRKRVLLALSAGLVQNEVDGYGLFFTFVMLKIFCVL